MRRSKPAILQSPEFFMRKLGLSLLALLALFLFASQNSWSQTELDTAKSKRVTIYVGETRRLPLDGISPFVADNDLLTLKELPPGQNIEIVGLRPGTTQVYYWKEGVLDYFVVEVLLSPVFGGTTLLTPNFHGNLPYFLYSFQNSSSFTQDDFYRSPAYGHSLVGTLPFHGGSVSSFASYTEQTETRSLPTAGLVYQTQKARFNLGPTGGQLSPLMPNFSSASVFGSNLALAWGGKTEASPSQNFSVFGGVSPQADLLDFSVGVQTYGLNYSITKQRPEQFFPNYANAGFVTYQLGGDDTFTFGGVMDGNLNLSNGISIAGGYARGARGGYEALIKPVIRTKRSLTTLVSSYLEHGLQGPSVDTPLSNDQYTTNFSTTHLLSDQRTNLRGGLFYNKIIPRSTTTLVFESEGLGGSLGISRNFSFQKSYGLTYTTFHSQSAGVNVLTSAVSANFSHPVTRASSLGHSASYLRSDLDSNSQGFALNHLFAFEKEKFRAYSALSESLTRGQNSQESIVFNQSLEVPLPKASLVTNLSYQKNILRDGNHIFTFNPAVNYPLTNNQIIALGGGLVFTEGDARSMNGALALSYQRYLGPGVTPDPLWKRLIGKRRKSTVEGNVFLDNNYNSFLDQPDKGIARVRVSLDGRRQILTDEKGFYRFSKVKEGKHALTLDPSSLKLDPMPEVPLKQTFTTDGLQSMTLPIPLTFKQATLQVRFVLDTNDNQKIDLTDDFLLINRAFVKLEAGETRWFSTKFQGGALVKGISKGVHVVGWDSMDLPENVEPLGPSEQKVRVTEHEEYPLVFFFRPIRSVRGQITTVDAKNPLPRSLIVQLGTTTSRVDEQGFYWLKDLSPGSFKLKIQNLPQTYCIDQHRSIPVQVPESILTTTIDLRLTTECDKTKQ